MTVGAILGMAAHLEGKGCGMIDMAGLAQKGGAVYSHVRLAQSPDDIHAIRVTAGAAHLVLGCDLVVTGTKRVLASVKQGRTALVVNTAEILPGDFTRDADFSLPTERIRRAILAAAGRDGVAFVDATAVATAILGNAIAANMFMLGYAFQKGHVPLAAASIEEAIRLNGEAVAMNLDAFAFGRRAAAEPERVAALMSELEAPTPSRHLSETLDEAIARRVAFLTEYQNRAYAERYRIAVERVRAAEAHAVANATALTDAVARNLFKLMAYKDEYEVARLYTDGQFAKQVAAAFEGDNLRYEFHLAPPLLARRDPATGVPRKMSFGPWMLKAFGVLARLKGLRGTPLDLFGYSRRAPDRAPARPRLRGAARRDCLQPHAAEPRRCDRPCGDPGEDPRLRPRQGAPPRGGEEGRGGAPRPLPQPEAAAGDRRGIACFSSHLSMTRGLGSAANRSAPRRAPRARRWRARTGGCRRSRAGG